MYTPGVMPAPVDTQRSSGGGVEIRRPIRWHERADGGIRTVLRSDYGPLVVTVIGGTLAGAFLLLLNNVLAAPPDPCKVRKGHEAKVVSEAFVLALPEFQSRRAGSTLRYGHPVNVIRGPTRFHSDDPVIGDIEYWFVKTRDGSFGWVAGSVTNKAGTLTLLVDSGCPDR